MYCLNSSSSSLERGTTASLRSGILPLPPDRPLPLTSYYSADAIKNIIEPMLILHVLAWGARRVAYGAASATMPPASLCPTNTSKDNLV